jgi:fatty acid/phospholipid biosynthesis enzyme
VQMSEVSGQLKRADLRAFCGSVEGLYQLEGEVRNMGISEGFTGKVERCLYLTEGVVPLVRACAKKIAKFLFGE